MSGHSRSRTCRELVGSPFDISDTLENDRLIGLASAAFLLEFECREYLTYWIDHAIDVSESGAVRR